MKISPQLQTRFWEINIPSQARKEFDCPEWQKFFKKGWILATHLDHCGHYIVDILDPKIHPWIAQVLHNE